MPATDPVATQSRPILVVLVAGAVSLAIALTAGLWAYYGTAVFFEMLRAGWAACFDRNCHARTARTSQILLILSAFLTGVVIFTGVSLFHRELWCRAGVRHWRSVQVDRPERQYDHRCRHQGEAFLVFFGYTRCPDVCPTTLFDVSEVMRALGKDADRTGALFITVDPEHDTPAVIKDYLSSFDPHLRGATGDRAAVDAVEKAYRVYAKKVPTESGDYTMDHTALVYLMDKQRRRFVAPFSLKRRPEAAADLRRYL